MKHFFAGSISLMLLACTVPDQQPVVQQIGDNHAATVVDQATQALGPDERFARDIARQRPAGSMDTTASNWLLRGIYIGRQGSCDAVNVRNVTLGRSVDYLVCGEQVNRSSGVAPTFPATGSVVLMSTARTARVNGQAGQIWEGYNIQARTIGPVRTDGCAMVQTTISYDGMLVDQTQEKICH